MLHRTRLALLTAACALAVAVPAAAQRKQGGGAGGTGQGDYVKVDFTEADWQGAYYTVFIPKGVVPGRTYPLVVALHGNGAKSDGHCRNIAKVSTNELPCFVVAPQYQQGSTFNNPRYPRCGDLFKTMLDQVLEKYPIDESRLVLQGFSMGGNYLASWTYAWMDKDPESYPFDLIWCSSTAIPPRDGQNGRKGEVAPRIPWLLMTGSKETAVKGVVNVVKQTRHAYRVFHQRGHDARYIEIPDMGHAVNARCQEIMRESLAALPSYQAAAKPVKKLPDAGKAALAHAAAGRFTEALDTLEALRAKESQLSTTEKGKIASQIKALEKWLKGHASSAPAALALNFSKGGYERFKALAVALKDHKTLGRTYAKAVEKLEKSKALLGQLQALAEFEAASKLEDAAAALAAMEKLAKGKLQQTVYGQRAAEHLQAMSDEYGSN